jgi:hypothetical protein
MAPYHDDFVLRLDYYACRRRNIVEVFKTASRAFPHPTSYTIEFGAATGWAKVKSRGSRTDASKALESMGCFLFQRADILI